MADSVRYGIGSVLDPGTGASSSAASGLPFSNLKNVLVRKVTRSTGKANEWWRFRASGGATGIQYVSIFNHNFSKNAVVLWQGNTTSNFASPALNTTLGVVTNARGEVVPQITKFYTSVQSYAHWRLYVRDSGNASSTLEVGRVMAGRYTQPSQNIRDGFTVRVIDPSRRRVTAGRQGYTNIRTPYVELEFGHTDLSEAQMDVMRGIYDEVGTHTAFMFSLSPDSRPSHESYYMQFDSELNQQHRTIRQFGLNSIRLEQKN